MNYVSHLSNQEVLYCHERVQCKEELDGKKAISLLGGIVEKTYTFTLPIEESERNIVVIKKEKQTPKKYPRKPGTPNKMPIE